MKWCEFVSVCVCVREREREREKGREILSFPNDVLHQMTWISVTRFGEISPFWTKVNNLWQTLCGLFSVWQHFEPT